MEYKDNKLKEEAILQKNAHGSLYLSIIKLLSKVLKERNKGYF